MWNDAVPHVDDACPIRTAVVDTGDSLDATGPRDLREQHRRGADMLGAFSSMHRADGDRVLLP